MKTSSKIIFAIIALILIIVATIYFIRDVRVEPNTSNNATSTPIEMVSTNIYLISQSNLVSGGMQIGCGDYVSALPVSIPKTETPLKDTFEKLLSFDPQKEYAADTFTSPVAKMNLKFENASIESGTAKINLSGKFFMNGVCDAPRYQAQFEKTALQFDTIKRVEIYINGIKLEDLMSEK